MSYRHLVLFIAFGVPLFGAEGNPVFITPAASVELQSCWIWTQTGDPAVGIPIYWTLSSNINAGFHYHSNPNAPAGSFPANPTYTEGNGCAYNTYYSPSPAGYMQLYMTTPNEADYWHSTIQVYVPNLYGLGPGNGYTLVGATQVHPYNNWGTGNVVTAMPVISQKFHSQHPDRTPGINDMSLPWGGTFDLGPSYGGAWWNPPHSEHALGLNADCPFRYIDPYRTDFYNWAVYYGGGSGCDPSGRYCGILVEGDHYHLRFAF